MKRYISVVLLCFVSQAFGAPVIYEYTHTLTGENRIPLGYEVPAPVESLTPVDGFRSYQSLMLRHQQLTMASPFIAQVEIGQSYQNRAIYAYQIGDADLLTHDGQGEGSALINGGIHAREWQTPEAVTAYMEYLFDHQYDQHLAQYLLENLQLTVIPVLNVDGFLQTQRFWNTVTDDISTPRDGRMRRKNMHYVDERLSTEVDNLLGVDLNRNNAPYWASSNRSSGNDSSLVYHGEDRASEPEIKALQQAAMLNVSDNLRLYIDTHSFSQIYYGPHNGNADHDRLTDRLAATMRGVNNYRYAYAASPNGSGIGSTDEYFAKQFNALSYTLEIEPQNSASEYGGFGVSHDGFILPATEVARMRQETTMATLSGLYSISAIPYLQAVQFRHADTNQVVLALEWQVQQENRVLNTITAGQLQPQQQYVVSLVFNKPMRNLVDGQAADFAQLSSTLGIQLALTGVSDGQNVSYPVQTDNGQWLAEQGYFRYKTDTFETSFTLAEGFDWTAHSLLALQVSSNDMIGQALDANPATVVTWQNGSWVNLENTVGSTTGDQGGTDNSLRLIDDGSPLFASNNTPPTPTPPAPTPPAPTPPAPTPPAPTPPGSGGGSLFWSLILLIITSCCRMAMGLFVRATK